MHQGKWLVAIFLLISVERLWGQIQFYGEVEPVTYANTDQNESFLMLSPAGELLIVRSNYEGNVGGKRDPGDLWVEKDSLFSNTRLKINSATSLTSPIGFSVDGTKLYYQETEEKRGQYGAVKVLQMANGSTEIVSIPELKNSSPASSGYLSIDGNYMILSLQRPNGYGVEDLYVVKKQSNGTWTSPESLGYRINTKFQEISPFLAPDNKTLVFATNAREGYGSFDLYLSTRLDDTWRNWTEPQNMGVVVNTEGSETSFAFLPGAQYAYFISTQNSDGYGDVKRIRIQTELEQVEVDSVLVEPEVTVAKGYQFRLQNARTSTPIPGIGLAEGEVQPDVTGVIQIPQDFSGLLEFKSQGYLSKEIMLPGAYAPGEEMAILLEPLESGNVITLEEVLFYRGTANFVEGSERELDMVVEMMNEHPEVSIFLKGHTDNVGDQSLNVWLSNERVLAVKTYLVEKGIAQERIDGKGFGGSQPIADNGKEETRQLNRRVEFEVIKK